MNKKLITSAVASAVALPTAAFAAIDDQGMAYVTAAEGLHGSLRMDLLLDTDEDNRDASTETNSLRMWVNGTADLGGGLQSTYFWEFRGNEGDSGTDVQSNAWDIGLKGAFGEIEFGKLAMSSYRLVPSASLAFERGSERKSPGADTKDGGWRFESPVINGFQFGISGILNGSDDIDGALNEYALALKYTMPIGLEVGGAYESVKNAGKQAFNPEKDREKSEGYRFGLRYGQDNWLLAYEFRTYDSFVDSDFGPIVAGINNSGVSISVSQTISPLTLFVGIQADGATVTLRNPFHTDDGGTATIGVIVTETTETEVPIEVVEDRSITSGEENADYNVHAFGVQVKLDRITMSANYSTEEVDVLFDNDLTDDDDSRLKYTKERETIAVDAAYALGSRAHIVLGWKQEDKSDKSIVYDEPAADAADRDDTSTTYLFYRVDF